MLLSKNKTTNVMLPKDHPHLVKALEGAGLLVEGLSPEQLALRAAMITGYAFLSDDTKELVDAVVKAVEEVKAELHKGADATILEIDELPQDQKEAAEAEIKAFNELSDEISHQEKMDAFKEIKSPAARMSIFKETLKDEDPQKAADLFAAELSRNPQDKDVILEMFKNASPEQRRLMLIDAMNDLDPAKQQELAASLEAVFNQQGLSEQEQAQAMVGVAGGIMQLAMGEPEGALTILKSVVKFVQTSLAITNNELDKKELGPLTPELMLFKTLRGELGGDDPKTQIPIAGLFIKASSGKLPKVDMASIRDGFGEFVQGFMEGHKDIEPAIVDKGDVDPLKAAVSAFQKALANNGGKNLGNDANFVVESPPHLGVRSNTVELDGVGGRS